jgi:hypothetical protein
MSKDSFNYKGRECVRKLLCFSEGATEHIIDRNSPILGVNYNIDSYRQLNSEMPSNLIDNLVKFWTSSPDLKFRYLVTSFQKYISRNSSKFTDDNEFRSSVLNLFIALFQQILIEINAQIMNRVSINSILRINQIPNSKSLMAAIKKFDIPYQKSIISQDSVGYVSQNISIASSKEYKNVIEELVNLLTINIK